MECGKLLVGFGVYLNTASQQLDDVCNDVVLENFSVICFQAVQNLATHRNDRLKLRISCHFYRAQCGITLHNIQFPTGKVFAAAIDKLRNHIGHINGSGELFCHVQTGALCALPTALIHQNLLCNFICLVRIFHEIDFQLVLEELRHCLVDKFIGDRLFGLVLVARLSGEAGGNQNQASLDISECDFRLVFQILSILSQVAVDLRHKRLLNRLFRRTAVLQPAGVMVVLNLLNAVGKCQRNIQLDFVHRLVTAILSLTLAAPVLDGSQCSISCNLLHIIGDAILIQVLLFRERTIGFLITVDKQQIWVYHSLSPEDVAVIFFRNVDLRENLQIRLPMCPCSRLLLLCGSFLQSAYILPLFKVQVVLISISHNLHIHIGRGKLCGTKAKSVQSKRIGVVIIICVIFSAGIQFTVHQFPVIPVLILVEIHRTSTAEILHLYRMILIPCDNDLIAIASTSFINGIRDHFKYGMGTSIRSIRAKNNSRTLSYLIRSFQHCNAFIIVALFFRHTLVLSSRKCQTCRCKSAEKEKASFQARFFIETFLSYHILLKKSSFLLHHKIIHCLSLISASKIVDFLKIHTI